MTKTTSTSSHPRAFISARLAGRCGSSGMTTGKTGSIVGAMLETGDASGTRGVHRRDLELARGERIRVSKKRELEASPLLYLLEPAMDTSDRCSIDRHAHSAGSRISG